MNEGGCLEQGVGRASAGEQSPQYHIRNVRIDEQPETPVTLLEQDYR